MKRLAVFSLVSSLCGCSSTSEPSAFQQGNSVSYLRIAEHMRMAGDYGTARNFYEQALRSDPSNLDARFGLAVTHAALGQLAPAEQGLKALLQERPSVPDYQLALAKVYVSESKTKDAAPLLTSVLQQDPENTAVLNLQGVLYDSEGSHEQAQAVYQRILEKQPENLAVTSNMGLSLALSGQHQKGIQLLETVVANPGAQPRDRHNLALAYGLSGDISMAEKHFQQDLGPEETQKNLAYLAKLRQDALVTSDPIDVEPLPVVEEDPRVTSNTDIIE